MDIEYKLQVEFKDQVVVAVYFNICVLRKGIPFIEFKTRFNIFWWCMCCVVYAVVVSILAFHSPVRGLNLTKLEVVKVLHVGPVKLDIVFILRFDATSIIE